jgi:DNA segregation ATPase FtsK/SpoIIIE, S-DNA-T family
MLSKEQQQEILAIGLLALALFLLLALIPVSVFGVGAAEWFPLGNVMGVVGGWVQSATAGMFGGPAFFLPILLLVGGLWSGNWLPPEWAARIGALSTGLLLLLPVGFHVLGWGGVEAAGAYGVVVGGPLMTGLGFMGAVILLSFLTFALSVVTLRWNPLRALASRAQQGGGAMAVWAKKLLVFGEAMKARWDEKLAARAERKALEAEQRRALAAALDAEEAEEPFQGNEVVVADDSIDHEVDSGDGAAAEDQSAGSHTEAESIVQPDASPEGPGPKPRAKTKKQDAGPPVEPFVMPEGELSETGLPPMEFMADGDVSDREVMEEELEELGHVLVEKLRTFKVECELGGRTTGPVVTQYEVIPAPGVKVNKIANLEADLALAMKAHAIRIVAPIPGKGAVGVEIPNPAPEVVRLRDILKARTFTSSKADLPLALGKDLNGKPFVADLRKMPHILIAGATGAGKSVCLNTIITSLVYKHTPQTLRFLMIDPKMVELSTYQDVPHLRHNVVTDPRDAAAVLKWAVMEMERRYALLSNNGVRSIGEFNTRVENGVVLKRTEPKGKEGDPDRWIYQAGSLPFIVVIIDELADLMMTVQAEVEKPLTLLAQKARAIGIHLIVATQRPSVNVITGLIKANFPARIAFRVASKTDSRTILDMNGADALLGNGDMLFLPPGQGEPVRIQGAFISTEETDRMMSWYRNQRDLKATLFEQNRRPDDPEPEPELPEADILEQMRTQELEAAAEAALEADSPSDWDELFRASAEVCISHDQASTSFLQRRLKIGYGRAARIVDQLHEAGILGPPGGAKGREILVSMDELDAICSANEI